MRDPGRRLSRATDTSLLRAGRRLSGSPVTQFAATGLLAVVVVHAELSDLTRPENRFDREHGPLRDIYVGITRVRLTVPASR
jgi:hypothetical protein